MDSSPKTTEIRANKDQRFRELRDNSFFGLDRAQNKIFVYFALRN